MVIIFKFDVKFENLFYLLIFPTLTPDDYGAEIWSTYSKPNDQWLLITFDVIMT